MAQYIPPNLAAFRECKQEASRNLYNTAAYVGPKPWTLKPKPKFLNSNTEERETVNIKTASPRKRGTHS